MSLIAQALPSSATRPLRIGFLGTGWIGRHRLNALMDAREIEPVLCDPSAAEIDAARAEAPQAIVAADFTALLDGDLDGLVIATPSALHAEQAIAALDRGIAVFCQKPLGRDAQEVDAIIRAAQRNDRLVGVDMSYRFTQAAQAVHGLIDRGVLGRIHSVDLTFHNAYGPDKSWFYDPRLAGGGCLIDLGVHLVDMALWMLGFPAVTTVHGDLKCGGAPLHDRMRQCEDVAFADLSLASGATVRLACSWKLHAGCDAQISAAFYGTQGGAIIRNMGGSFYDFIAEHMTGTHCTRLAEPPDVWGGRAIVDWAERLARNPCFDRSVTDHLAVATVLDRIYAYAAGRAGGQ